MKIGIIGSGNMGRSLGILWAELGHQVFFGAPRFFPDIMSPAVY